MQGRIRAALAGLALLTVAGCQDGGTAVPASSAASASAAAPTSATTPTPPAPAPTVTDTSAPLATPDASATPDPPATPSAAGVVRGDCSSSEVPSDLPDAGVTATVAATREALFLAALACDYDALGAVASANPEGFSYSFGDDGDPAGYWHEAEERGDRVMFALAALLRLEAREQTAADGGDYVVWPAATVEDATDADWQEVADSGIYTPEEVEQLRSQVSVIGGYAGWRTAIDAEGHWDFFIAGD